MIQPLFNQILVKPIEQKQLIIAEKKTLCEYGEVLAVGEDVKKVKVGNKIGFTIWGLNSLDIDGTRHYFVQENPDFLLGIINESLG